MLLRIQLETDIVEAACTTKNPSYNHMFKTENSTTFTFRNYQRRKSAYKSTNTKQN